MLNFENILNTNIDKKWHILKLNVNEYLFKPHIPNFELLVVSSNILKKSLISFAKSLNYVKIYSAN